MFFTLGLVPTRNILIEVVWPNNLGVGHRQFGGQAVWNQALVRPTWRCSGPACRAAFAFLISIQRAAIRPLSWCVGQPQCIQPRCSTTVFRPSSLSVGVQLFGGCSVADSNSPTPAQAVAHSYMNRAEVEQSSLCGCYQCLATFPPSDVVLWSDSTDPNDEDPGALRPDASRYRGMTAICPFCEDSAVLGSASGAPITHEFLQQVHEYWCSRRPAA